MARLLFIGPWWVRILASAAFVCLAAWFWQLNDDKLAAREALIAQKPPAVIPIAEMEPDHALDVQEVSLRAVVALEHNTHLVEKTNFITTNEDLMYVLQDEDAGEDQPLVRGVILVEPAQKDSFIAWVLAHSVDYTATGPVIELNGLIGDSRNGSHVSKALREAGLKEAPNFAQVEPFLVSRASALEHLPADSNKLPWIMLLGAAVFALFGLRERHVAARRKVAPNVPAPTHAPMPHPVPLSADEIEARLAQPRAFPPRETQQAEARVAAPQTRISQDHAQAEPRYSLTTSARLVLALGVLLVLAAAVGLLLGPGAGAPKAAAVAPAVGPIVAHSSQWGELVGVAIALVMIPITILWKVLRLFRPRSSFAAPSVKGWMPLLGGLALYFGMTQLAHKIGVQPMPSVTLPGMNLPGVTLPSMPSAMSVAPPTTAAPDVLTQAAFSAPSLTLPPALLPGLAVVAVILLGGFVLRNGGWRTRRHDTTDHDPWNRIERERLR